MRTIQWDFDAWEDYLYRQLNDKKLRNALISLLKTYAETLLTV